MQILLTIFLYATQILLILFLLYLIRGIFIAADTFKSVSLWILMGAYIIGTCFLGYRIFTHIPSHPILLSLIDFICMLCNYYGPYNEFFGYIIPSDLPYGLDVDFDSNDMPRYHKRLFFIIFRMSILFGFVILANLML